MEQANLQRRMAPAATSTAARTLARPGDGCVWARTRRPGGAGDWVVIPPGTAHRLGNTGPERLVLPGFCAPAYSDDDTVMTGG